MDRFSSTQLVAGVIISIVIVTMILGLSLTATSQPLVNMRTNENLVSYDPTYYQIPAAFAGYPVLAVRSAENALCVPDDRIEVWFSVPDDRAFIDIEALETAFSSLWANSPEMDYCYGIIPRDPMTRDQFIEQNESPLPNFGTLICSNGVRYMAGSGLSQGNEVCGT